MKAILFCNLPYAFSILKPLQVELEKRGIDYLWFVPKDLVAVFPYHDSAISSEILEIERYQSDMVFVPGNDVPWYLHGLKVQIFHGLAGEKKGHFRIRDFFDLYLTQGPYFTQRFEVLSKKHQNFSVKETGWCKLDTLYQKDTAIQREKASLLTDNGAQKIILYAPTFSPSLTSAEILFEEIIALSQNPDYLIIIKFHDKMDKTLQQRYEAKANEKLLIFHDDDISRSLKIADIMISDTSSVVYEFLLLDKPVITLNSHSENILWENIHHPDDLAKSIHNACKEDSFMYKKRQEIIALYHPYHDGLSAKRMIDASLDYIKAHSTPKKRKISLLRKYKMIKKYGLVRW